MVEEVCPLCNGAGVIHPRRGDGSVDYTAIVGCECMREEHERDRRQLLLKYCKLPFGSEKLTIDNFDVDKRWPSLNEAKQAALGLAEETTDIKWLTLLGEVDCGKTHLAIAICRRWIERDKAARYVLIPQMLDDLREGYNQDKQRASLYQRDKDMGLSGEWSELPYEAQMQMLKGVDLLVLDDLGAQVPTPWAMEKLMMLIDHRSVNGLPLVITTNKKLTELPGDDEHRIGSRLLRFSAGKMITIDAPEYRTWRKK